MRLGRSELCPREFALLFETANRAMSNQAISRVKRLRQFLQQCSSEADGGISSLESTKKQVSRWM
jgi:hypothetical protein